MEVIVEPYDKPLKVGDVIEPKNGMFISATQAAAAGEHIRGKLVLEIPNKRDYSNEYQWTNALNDVCLDLILDSKSEKKKRLYLKLMKYVKETYGK